MLSYRGQAGQALASHFAAADVLAFPSCTDTFGLVLLEAMAYGIPVAAYLFSGSKDVVVNGKTGFLNEDLAVAAGSIAPHHCRAYAEQFS